MYCVHARKRVSEAPRTHFRAGQISKFLGGVLPDPLRTIHIVEPHLLYLPWASPILSAALLLPLQTTCSVCGVLTYIFIYSNSSNTYFIILLLEVCTRTDPLTIFGIIPHDLGCCSLHIICVGCSLLIMQTKLSKHVLN